MHSYGVACGADILTTVFIVDQEGLIRRVFQPDSSEDLPNPATVLRALNNLGNTPKPPEMTSDDWRLGAEDAPIVIIEYGDYQCRHCRDFCQAVIQLMPHYQNKIQFIFRHFSMRHAHPYAIQTAQAAEAAGRQGKFWEMHARLFAADNLLEMENLLQYAQEVGLNITQFNMDIDDSITETSVMEDYRTAVKHRIKSPPTVFINSILFEGLHTSKALKEKIDELLACF